jgi:hypothetical protein
LGVKRLLWALLLLTALAGAAQEKAFAVFTEFSPNSLPMQPGWNRRVFTAVTASRGQAIQCDLKTGLVTLAPGTYRLTGFSTVTYESGGNPPEMATVRAPASAGYCRLRWLDPQEKPSTDPRGIPNDHPSVICLGSTTTANFGSSTFETYVTTEKTRQLFVEHQCGNDPQQIFLRVYVENSPWHLMARISVQQL